MDGIVRHWTSLSSFGDTAFHAPLSGTPVKLPPEPALALLHEAHYGTLATNSGSIPGYPFATLVPYVLDEAHRPVICVSALAEHTRNLLADPRASFSVLQAGATDVHDSPRLTFVADAGLFEPAPELRARYLRYEPRAEQLLALDFAFFRLNPRRVRYIGGVGKMGWLESEDWAALPRLPAKDEARVIQEAAMKVASSVKLLGADCFGIDYEVAGERKRQRFPGAPLPEESLTKVAVRMAPGLA